MSLELNNLAKERPGLWNAIFTNKTGMDEIEKLNDNWRRLVIQLQREHGLSYKEAETYIAKKDKATLAGCDENNGGW